MKKRYQIRAQRAIHQFQEWANGNVDPIQLMLPAADMLKQSLGELLRQVGKMFDECPARFYGRIDLNRWSTVLLTPSNATLKSGAARTAA